LRIDVARPARLPGECAMMRLPRYAGRALAVVLVGAAVTAASIASASPMEGAIRGADVPAKDVVPGQYIVVFKKTAVRRGLAATTANSLASTFGGHVMHAYDAALSGFSIATDEQGARRIAADPNVDYVQPVYRVRATDVQNSPPSWGLDRIDQAYLPLDNKYSYPTTAPDVTVYIVDTGINPSHPDFDVRAEHGFDFVGGVTSEDCFIHGTHVAGTVGGAAMGVAKSVLMQSVRVLDCNGEGTSDTVIRGLNWIATDWIAPLKVVNLSLGETHQDPALDTAVRNLIAARVTVVVAAGNGDDHGNPMPACFASPADVAEAITVGAVDRNDRRADFSNYGTCVDLYAPGVDIPSDNATDYSTPQVLSGTSMATPHVAGAAALLLEQHQGWPPAFIQQALVSGTYDTHRILDINATNPPGPPPAGSWSQANPPAVGSASRVALASTQINPGTGRVDAFVASNAPGHPILHASKTGTGAWTPWANLGGITTGNPTAVWSAPGQLDLFVEGADHSVYHRALLNGVWAPYEALGGIVRADLVAASREPGVVDLYATGTDSGIWHRTFNGYAWSAWGSFGGRTLNHNFSVAVDPTNGMEHIFVQGIDGQVWWKKFDGYFQSGWTPLGGIARNDVKAVATSDGHIEIFVPGTDTGVWFRRLTGTSWSPWNTLGGLTTGGGVEAVAGDNGFVDVFVRGTNGFIYTRHFDNTSWNGWTPLNFDVSSTLPAAVAVAPYQLEEVDPTSTGGVDGFGWS
jgi:subtilisin family serine protease